MTSGTRVGTVIEDKYRLDEQIGRGSMGAVYRGTQLMVDRSVAIKLLHPTFAGHDKIQARFEVEAKAIARLNHPNCITLFDFGYSDELQAFYTVVEYIDGIPLGDLINQRPATARVVDLIRQAASALGHAHHHGILHRDLKPENIMLANMTDGSEMVKVLDFGIAQIMKGGTEDDEDGTNEFESDRITRVGEVFGTPPYMSPEQCESAHDLSPATDIYSLGIIFYELLEGRLPFFADTPVEIMRMHLHEEPPPMKRRGLPDSLRALVLQMLAKHPAERPAGGGEIVKTLAAIPAEALEDSGPIARAPGNAHQSEPTMLEAPPKSETIIVDSEVENEEASDKSEIYELKDLVGGLQAFGASSSGKKATDEEPESSASPTPQKTTGPPRPGLKSPNHQAAKSRTASAASVDVGDDNVDELAVKLALEEKKNVIFVILALLFIIGGLAWFILTYQPFSMAGEDDMRTIGEVAAEVHQDHNDSREEAEPAPATPDEPLTAEEETEPREFVVSNDEETEEEEEATAEEAAPAPRPRRTQQRRNVEPHGQETTSEPQQRSQPRRLGVDDAPAGDDDDAPEPQRREPPRLGL